MARRRTNATKDPGEQVLAIPLDEIRPDKNNPRQHFDPEALNELADCIEILGQLEPGLVRRLPDGGRHKYELIAGERRLRACRLKGIPTLKAIVREVSDKHDQLERALAANYCREEPAPMDTARALHRLMDSPRYRGLGVTERRTRIGKICGKTGTWVNHMLALLKLSDEVQEMMDPADPQALPAALGTFLANNFTDRRFQVQVARRARDERLSVRETRRVAKRMARETGNTSALRDTRPSDDWRFLDRFIAALHEGCETFKELDKKKLKRMLGMRTDAELTEALARLDSAVGRVAELRNLIRDAAGKNGSRSAKEKAAAHQAAQA